jgi:hypothetical protein
MSDPILRVGTTDVVRIALVLEGEMIGHVDVATALTEGADGKEDVTVVSAVTVFGPLGPEQTGRIGFRQDMKKRASGPKEGD